MNISNALIYCRVSTPRQAHSGHYSLAAQFLACKSYCDSHNLPIKSTFHDVNSARDILKLPNLQSLASSSQSGDVIIFYDVSRFSRNVAQGISLLNSLSSKGVSVFSVKERCSYLETHDIHLFNILLCSSEYESRLLSDRVKQSFQFRKFSQSLSFPNSLILPLTFPKIEMPSLSPLTDDYPSDHSIKNIEPSSLPTKPPKKSHISHLHPIKRTKKRITS